MGKREACALGSLGRDAIAGRHRWRRQRQLEHEFSACLGLVAPHRVARHTAGCFKDPSVMKKPTPTLARPCVFHNTTWHCWCSPQPSGLRALLFINTGCSVQVAGFCGSIKDHFKQHKWCLYWILIWMKDRKCFSRRSEGVFLLKRCQREEKKKPKAIQTKKRKSLWLEQTLQNHK